jgi:hypothetical protein
MSSRVRFSCVASTPLGEEHFVVLRDENSITFSMAHKGQVSLENMSESAGVVTGEIRGIAPFPFIGNVTMSGDGGSVLFFDGEVPELELDVVHFSVLEENDE